MQPPLAAAGPGRVWLRTQDGNYVQMSAEARATVLRNQAASGGGGVEQVCPHGLPLPAAHEDEVERAKVAALKADFVAQEVQNTAAVPVRMTAAGESVRANIAQFGAQAARLDAVALRTFPPRADAALQNVANLAGAIAVADRGSNAFVDKARRAQDAGAIGLVIVNSDDTAYVPICSPDGGGEAIRIPVVCVKRSDGLRFRNPCAVTLEYGYMPAGYGSDEEASGQPAAGAADGADGGPRSSVGDTSTGTAELMAPDPEAVSFLVTVPDGQVGGSRMVVTAPDGRQVAIDVPAGVVSGQQLQVNLPAVRDRSDEDGDSLSYDEDDYSDYTDEGEVDYSEDEEGAGVGLSPSSTEGREEGRRRDGSEGDGLGDDDSGEDPEDPPLAFEVTVPTGVESGQQLRVQAPDGRSAVITVPAGVGSGQRIRVQLPPKPPAETALRQGGEMSGEEAADTPEPNQEGLQGGERPLQPPPSATDHVATGSSKEAESAAPPEAAGAGMAKSDTDPAATMLTVVVPEGVVAGQQLRVQAPDGRHAMITVPTGVLPGQQLRLSLPVPAPDSSSLPSAAAEVEGGARTPKPDRAPEDRHGEPAEPSRATEADVESGIGGSIPTSSSGASRASELPPATPGKLWYRDTDGELRQLTPQQRRIVIANLREQGMTPAAQLDDSGALLPVPPELAAELAAESSQRAAAEDGLSYIDSLMQAMLGTAWKYLTGADLLPTDPQDVLSAR